MSIKWALSLEYLTLLHVNNNGADLRNQISDFAIHNYKAQIGITTIYSTQAINYTNGHELIINMIWN